MPEPEENKDPKEDNPQEQDSNQEQSEQPKDNKSKEQHIENTDDLPEKFKGKTASEIAKSYLDLERELGRKSVSQKRLDELEQLRSFIASDKELVEMVQKKLGQPAQEAPKNDDTRAAMTNTIVSDFEREFGIDKLKAEDRQSMHEKIGQELADILDPSGTKTVAEIVASIDLTRLPKYLSKAYRLATVGDEAEAARLKGIMEARQNSEATFSSMPSSGARGSDTTLSEDERATAKKLGISEEAYLKQKKALN